MSGRSSALEVSGVGKTFGRRRALSEVTGSFASGEVTALLGPNGAGKTTLLELLATLLEPTTGSITFNGERLGRGSPRRAEIGYVGHESGLYGDLSARQNLDLHARLYRLPDTRDRVEAALARSGTDDVPRDAPVRTLSRGIQQRVALARALLPGPRILLFDEPGAALDPAGAEWLVAELARERTAGRLVVLVTHDLAAAARIATHVVILRRGRVTFDERREGGFVADTLRATYQDRTGGAV